MSDIAWEAVVNHRFEFSIEASTPVVAMANVHRLWSALPAADGASINHVVLRVSGQEPARGRGARDHRT